MYSGTNVLIYLCTHVFMYLCTYVLMYLCPYVLVHSCTNILIYSCTPQVHTASSLRPQQAGPRHGLRHTNLPLPQARHTEGPAGEGAAQRAMTRIVSVGNKMCLRPPPFTTSSPCSFLVGDLRLTAWQASMVSSISGRLAVLITITCLSTPGLGEEVLKKASITRVCSCLNLK